MFAVEKVTPTPGKMEARKELRMHRADEARIRAAVEAPGKVVTGLARAAQTSKGLLKDAG